ncbi:MAG: peptidylprolyl isomerase [Candidatus Cloacimonetes bacterium]|nr:peptidylprolyl isomerase [Candidatus Cloacimonadota bacterium]
MIIAKVDNYNVLDVEYKAELRNTLLRLKLEEPTLEAKKAAINQLIDGYILLHKAKSTNVNIGSEDVDNKFVEISMKFKTKEEFEKVMNAQNLNENKLREQIINELTIRKYIGTKFSETREVDEKKLEKIYQENIDSFKTQVMVKASHILIKGNDEKSLKKIIEIRERINSSKEFHEEAKKCSECPSCCNSGDLGYFSFGKMVKEFDNVAFNLEIDQISEPVKTQFGYHLIMVTDKKASKIAKFEEVKDSLKKRLQQIETELNIVKHIKELRAKADVEIYEEKL